MRKKANEWISIADLMSALMMVFMLIMLALIIKEKKAVSDTQKSVVKITKALSKEFGSLVLKDGTIRFSSSAGVGLFKIQSYKIEAGYKRKLNWFCPRYIGFLSKHFREHIREIQIIGHASTDGIDRKNLGLSTKRAWKVYNHCYQKIKNNKKLASWFSKKVVVKGAGIVWPLKKNKASRRVEFRFMTSQENEYAKTIRNQR